MELMLVPAPRSAVLSGGTLRFDENTPVSEKTGLPSESREGYELTVGKSGVTLFAASDEGLFRGRQTLLMLTEVYGNEIPCAVIKDEPVFPYRGFMLDCARHFFGIEDIKKLIDAAALMKLNYFHWHLSDDQGFRFISESYPKLYSVGSVRKCSDFGGVHEPDEYSACFTKDELREIVAYCAQRHITVVPEFDIPGHNVAAIASYPHLSCTGKQLEVERKEGIFPDVLCIGKESTFDFVFSILDEIAEVFPGEYIHIGGDEAPRVRWNACPDCQKRMRDEGLKNGDELQGYFMKRVTDYLRAKGKKPIVWNESLKGNMLSSEDVTVQRWMDREKLSPAFAANGGKMIESDFYHYYFDYPYGMTPLKKTYCESPLANAVNDTGRLNTIGVECELWTEHIRDFPYLCHMLFPRVCAVAELGWTPEQLRSYPQFKQRLHAVYPLLESRGITPAPESAFDPPPIKRLSQLRRFFSGMLSLDMIKNTLNNRDKAK